MRVVTALSRLPGFVARVLVELGREQYPAAMAVDFPGRGAGSVPSGVVIASRFEARPCDASGAARPRSPAQG
ncbi:hypothetical protein ABEG18_07020 [Alsobacter sp. KACC 23698]|uniref:Uncharacterized protein n=1 Tax=Alsobacter sp. KACC 23698 TaxID=3149229 RepID=A0AAU7JJN6_9HYPH